MILYSSLLQKLNERFKFRLMVSVSAISAKSELTKILPSAAVTAVWSYISDGPYKTYEWNSIKLEFKHRTNKEITGLSYMTILVIQALKTGKSQ